ncbi:Rieske 2Fe-2S domain-containing protein [Mycobacterium decipiens]|uniref:Rieske domain-containing protein n=1 Tax=Mycobacterium decipiens TaxID=1430326 RepID=A0A1X2LWW0_9MYCO|nr:Rieske 2Fe-2S domain-containing protein [Mycobacterium decipiens]OSC41667.1 hypothetical protein B8W66_08065 [Mycobacterium decipiens]
MWVPVFETSKLGEKPEQVVYWGSPVALFRTASGRIAALHDACAHRGAPLSLGNVCGETVRCPYHQFCFNSEGSCTSIPDVFQVDDAFRAGCRVRRYHVREALGLIWISTEDERQAPFPVSLLGEDDREVAGVGFFPVRGDIRVWMDHFLDLPHGIYLHGKTLFGGGADRPSRVGSVATVELFPDSVFPIPRWLQFEYHVEDVSLRRRLYSPGLAVFLLLAGAGGMRPDRVRVTIDLAAPFCQKYRLESWSPLGNHSVEYWTAINPSSRDELQFVYAGAFVKTAFGPRDRRNPVVRALQRRGLHYFLERHIGGEDARVLSETRMVDPEDIRVTPFDAGIVAMREMLRRHIEARAEQFPPDSLVHLFCGPARTKLSAGRRITVSR